MQHRGISWGVLLGLGLTISISHAADAPTTTSAVPHLFVPGQVISADQLNENFAAVKPDLAETLIGTWSTQCWDNTTSDFDVPGTGQIVVTSLDAISHTGAVCLASDPAYRIVNSYTFGPANTPDNYDSPYTIATLLPVQQSAVLRQVTQDGTPTSSTGAVTVLQLNPDTIMFSVQRSGIELWTRLDGPPANPRDLTVTQSDATVTLSWSDRSSNETSFQIRRRYSATGSLTGSETFDAIGTTSADVTSFSETLSTAGTYWYRVSSVGTNGTSLGSNLVKVTIE